MSRSLVFLLLWAACGLAEPRLDAGIFVPARNVQLRADTITLYAAQGAIVASDIDEALLSNLLTGLSGRLVAATQAPLAAGPSRLSLSFSAAELQPNLALAETDPTGAAIELTNLKRLPDGAVADVSLTLITPTEPSRAGAGAPVAYVKREFVTRLDMRFDRPMVLLIHLDEQGQGGAPSPQQQAVDLGGQRLTAVGPMVGVALALIGDGRPLKIGSHVPPVAPAGKVAVRISPQETAELPWGPRLTSGAVLDQLGLRLAPGGTVRVARLQQDGTTVVTVARGNPRGVVLESHDLLSLASPHETSGGDPVSRGPQPRLGFGGGASGAGLPGAPVSGGAVASFEATGDSASAARRGPSAFGGSPIGYPPLTVAATAESAEGALPRLLSLPDLERALPAAARAADAVVLLRGSRPDGSDLLLSATLVSADGLCVSAPMDVLSAATSLTATLADGRVVPARVLHLPPADSPLAILRLGAAGAELSGLPFLKPSASSLEPGAPLLVIGNPLGLARSVSFYVVAQPRTSMPAAPGSELILDRPLATGQSGGAVVDLSGKLVGIASGSLGSQADGLLLGLAVPAELVERALGAVEQQP